MIKKISMIKLSFATIIAITSNPNTDVIPIKLRPLDPFQTMRTSNGGL